MRTGTNVNGFGLMSHVPCYPLKGSVLSVVHIMGRGNPGQTIQSNLGIVGAESGLCATIHWDSSWRVPICYFFIFRIIVLSCWQQKLCAVIFLTWHFFCLFIWLGKIFSMVILSVASVALLIIFYQGQVAPACALSFWKCHLAARLFLRSNWILFGGHPLKLERYRED